MKRSEMFTRSLRGGCRWLVVALVVVGGVTAANAQTWTGGGTDDNWTTADNWTGGTPSTSSSGTSTVTFYNTGAARLENHTGGRYNLNQIAFNAEATSPVTITVTPSTTAFNSGTAIRFNAGSNISVAAGNHKIAGSGSGTDYDVIFNGASGTSHTFDIASGASFEIQGRLHQGLLSNNKDYFKTGGGTLILSGSNSGSGSWQIHSSKSFQIQGGAVRFAAGNVTGNTANNYTVSSGAAFEIGGVSLQLNNGNVTLNGTGIGNTGALRSISGTSTLQGNNATGTIVLSTDSSIGVDAGTLTLKKVISGSGALTKVGAGTLVLDGTLQGSPDASYTNTYTGNTTISAGTLRLNGSLDEDSAVTVENNATLAGAGTVGGDVTIEDGGTFLADGDALTVDGTLTLGTGTILDLSGITPVGTDPIVLISYGTRVGAFDSVVGFPADWDLVYSFGGNQIAIVSAMWIESDAGVVLNGGTDTLPEVFVDETLTRTYVITNVSSGSIALTDDPAVVLDPASAAGFSISANITGGDRTIAAGSSAEFTLSFSSSVTGTFSGTVSIANDTGQNPYSFDVVVDVSQGPMATGGSFTNTYTDAIGNLWAAHVFTNGGFFTASQELEVEYLVVGGGGAGGRVRGGGGGAGGFLTGTTNLLADTYGVVVGAGGLGASTDTGNGRESSFGNIVAAGGGRGGRHASDTGSNGQNGGSGGGGGGFSGRDPGQPVPSGQGNAGGGGGSTDHGGGGGGAGVAGSAHDAGSHGGNGVQSAITGTNTWYAGGGGGMRNAGGQSDGGLGGGGKGAGNINNTDKTSGEPNTGGGGGGAGNVTDDIGGDGGSGIVVVRYMLAAATMQVLYEGESILYGATNAFPVTIGSPVAREYVVTNINASANIVLTGNPHAVVFSESGTTNYNGFTITQNITGSSTNLAPGESASFAVQFSAAVEGTYSATVSIANSDPARNPYTFEVRAVTRVYLTGSNASDDNWNTAADWSDLEAPSGTKDYLVHSSRTLRTPDSADQQTFAGRSLTLGNSTTQGRLRLQRPTPAGGPYTRTTVVNNLTIVNGSVETFNWHTSHTLQTGSESAIEVQGPLELRVRSDTASSVSAIIVDAVLSGSGASIDAQGRDMLTYQNQVSLQRANTVSGTIRSTEYGNLIINHANAVQNLTLNRQSGDTGIVTFNQNSTVGGLMGSESVNFGGYVISVGNNNEDTTYSGEISNGSLTKIGTGTLTLSGANTYTGATTVEAGTLRVDGSLAAGSAVTVNDGGVLAGEGTIGGDVTVTAGGNVSPGSDSVEQLTIGGGLDISAMAVGAGKLYFELGSIAVSDKIAVTGILTIGDGALGFSDFDFTNLGGAGLGVYTLITSSGIADGNTLDGNNLTGTVAGISGTLQLQINGNNLVLAIPAQPSVFRFR